MTKEEEKAFNKALRVYNRKIKEIAYKSELPLNIMKLRLKDSVDTFNHRTGHKLEWGIKLFKS